MEQESDGMRETIMDIADMLNPWYFLYLAFIFGVLAICNYYPSITGFICGLSIGLYIKNRNKMKRWI